MFVFAKCAFLTTERAVNSRESVFSRVRKARAFNNRKSCQKKGKCVFEFEKCALLTTKKACVRVSKARVNDIKSVCSSSKCARFSNVP